jgi:hypothetical protein
MITDPGKLPNLDVPQPSIASYIAVGVVALVLVLFGLGVFGGIEPSLAGWLLRIGAFLLAAGLVFVTYAASQRNRPGRLPGIAEDSISYNIARLTQRRDILRTAWLWFLVPLVPGIALLYAGAAMQPEIGPLSALLGLAVCAVAFVAIAVVTTRTAKQLDTQIAELEKQRPR